MAEFASGNIFIRKVRLKKGDVLPGHKHGFDHTTIFFSGAWHVKAKLPTGQLVEHDFHAPNHALIRKDVEHEITCLEDGEFWCVYAHRTPQGDVVQIATGWPAAYV